MSRLDRARLNLLAGLGSVQDRYLIEIEIADVKSILEHEIFLSEDIRQKYNERLLEFEGLLNRECL